MKMLIFWEKRKFFEFTTKKTENRNFFGWNQKYLRPVSRPPPRLRTRLTPLYSSSSRILESRYHNLSFVSQSQSQATIKLFTRVFHSSIQCKVNYILTKAYCTQPLFCSTVLVRYTCTLFRYAGNPQSHFVNVER